MNSHRKLETMRHSKLPTLLVPILFSTSFAAALDLGDELKTVHSFGPEISCKISGKKLNLTMFIAPIHPEQRPIYQKGGEKISERTYRLDVTGIMDGIPQGAVLFLEKEKGETATFTLSGEGYQMGGLRLGGSEAPSGAGKKIPYFVEVDLKKLKGRWGSLGRKDSKTGMKMSCEKMILMVRSPIKFDERGYPLSGQTITETPATEDVSAAK